MIAIVDYGVGNLFSLQSSLKKIGEESVVTSDKRQILSANSVILPGVGAFGDAAEKLRTTKLDVTVKTAVENGKPLLGICLGMQLLFTESNEYGAHKGLNLICGQVVSMKEEVSPLKTPHMGWNKLEFNKNSKLFKYTAEGDYVYFVHSYHAKCDEKFISATCNYGINVCAAVENANVYGTQFHPEKSGTVGLKILKAFAEIK